MKFFIEIEELKVDTIIGVFEEERLKPQTILISIKCQLDIDHNQDLDNIENVTSYSDIKNEIIKFVSASQYKTLEKLITDLKKHLDDKFPIQIEKLEINKIEIAKKYNAKKLAYRYKSYIAIGSNIGNWRSNFNNALNLMNKFGYVKKVSRVYFTKPLV